MPHRKGKLKLSGDTHLPDVESDLDIEAGTTGMAALAKDRTEPRGAASRVRHAGVVTAGDDADSRMSFEAPKDDSPGP